MEKHLHIICLNVPYPVDYGGVFDLFYKLPSLQQQGVKIHLHCFDYGRGQQNELNKYCESVNYYERIRGHKSVSSRLPYIVASRKNEQLFTNLLKDDYPIFMEGIHCTALLNDERFSKRRKYVRVHNVEYQYYQDLYKSASQIFKKIYFLAESRLLKKYEHSIAIKATAFWSVTQKDADVYREKLGCKNIELLPLYLPLSWKVQSLEGKGNFCLYQADLSVAANEKAAIWLLENIFNKTSAPFVIAGKNPSDKLEKIVHSHTHACLAANPSEKEMQDMIAKAHINILPSFHNTGIKLKLLNALYNGRHCVVNTATVEGSGLESLCNIADTAEDFIQQISSLLTTPFEQNEINKRSNLLTTMFDNEANAKQQVKWIWGE